MLQTYPEEDPCAETNGGSYLVGFIHPVYFNDELLAWQCPVCGYAARDRGNLDKSGRYRGCVETNSHICKKHPSEALKGIVWRALYIDEDGTHPLVVTHHVHYPQCKGTGVPIQRIHTLDSEYDVRHHTMQRVSRKRFEPEASASASDVPTTEEQPQPQRANNTAIYEQSLLAAVEASKHSKVTFINHGSGNGFTMEFSPP